jgi:hypothetical protein
MEIEVIRRVLAKVIKKEYPESLIEDIALTREPDFMSYYIDKEKNLKYNVWIIFENYDAMNYYQENSEDWMELKDFVKKTMKAIGLNQQINVYSETSEDY